MKPKKRDVSVAAISSMSPVARPGAGGREPTAPEPKSALAARCAAALLGEGRGAKGLSAAFAHLAPALELDAFLCVGLSADGAPTLLATEGFASAVPPQLRLALGFVAMHLGTVEEGPVSVGRREPYGELAELLESHGFVASLAVGLLRAGRPSGALLLASRTRSEFSAAEIGVVDVVGTCLAAGEELRSRDSADHAIERVQVDFLTVLTHELRNRSAVVRNALEIMRANERQPSAVASSAHAMIERQLEQVAWLADDLLDANQALLGRVELDKKKVSLAAVLERAAGQSRPWIEASRQELTIDLPREPISLYADARVLARAFSSLFNNAARHIGRGGGIAVTAEAAEERVDVRVRVATGDVPASMVRELIAMVEDGVVPAARALGGFTASAALVKLFVEMHGGAIAAANVDRGVEFSFSLPLAAAAATAQPAPPPSEPVNGRSAPQRILVADDNADSAESTGMLLRLMGNDVRIAADGLEAVELADSFQPDIVLLDIGMPRLDGYEAARRIRSMSWSRDALLVAVTGWGRRDDGAEAAAAGFDRHFTKPLDPAELRKLVTEQRPG
jgi:CheY-like chemotaxis protein/signal transduction histidine kinase